MCQIHEPIHTPRRHCPSPPRQPWLDDSVIAALVFAETVTHACASQVEPVL
jgi:hypothetical protein